MVNVLDVSCIHLTGRKSSLRLRFKFQNQIKIYIYLIWLQAITLRVQTSWFSGVVIAVLIQPNVPKLEYVNLKMQPHSISCQNLLNILLCSSCDLEYLAMKRFRPVLFPTRFCSYQILKSMSSPQSPITLAQQHLLATM